MERFAIQSGGAELLEQIEPLWLELREHHAALSPIWRQGLLEGTFEARQAELLGKARRGLLVVLAVDGDTPVGYCVSTITEMGQGDIDSLFVTAAYRRRGIAHRMVSESIQWLLAQSAKPIAVEVMAGNEQAAHLYEQFGFKVRTLRMRQVSSSSPGTQSTGGGGRQIH